MSEKTEVLTDQYLTFSLDGESFGVSIEKVREVLTFTKVTDVPCTPDYVRGVINLRGNVVPVIDLKKKFALGSTEKTIDTCIVIVSAEVAAEPVTVGFLADSLQEVFDIDAGSIEPPPKIGTRINTDYIQGMGKRGEEFIILLDIDCVFSAQTEGFYFTGQAV